jgi:hypothetical protein
VRNRREVLYCPTTQKPARSLATERDGLDLYEAPKRKARYPNSCPGQKKLNTLWLRTKAFVAGLIEGKWILFQAKPGAVRPLLSGIKRLLLLLQLGDTVKSNCFLN